MDFIFFVWCEKGSMECVVDLPCLGKVELISDW